MAIKALKRTHKTGVYGNPEEFERMKAALDELIPELQAQYPVLALESGKIGAYMVNGKQASPMWGSIYVVGAEPNNYQFGILRFQIKDGGPVTFYGYKKHRIPVHLIPVEVDAMIREIEERYGRVASDGKHTG